MYEWIIHYESRKALEEVLKTGEVSYKPRLDVGYIVMKSYLPKETIMKIEGVTNCRTPEIGKLCLEKQGKV